MHIFGDERRTYIETVTSYVLMLSVIWDTPLRPCDESPMDLCDVKFPLV